jgi:hypothetical protein
LETALLKQIPPAKTSFRLSLIFIPLAFLALLASGCGLVGGDDDDAPTSVASTQTTYTPAPGEVSVVQAAMSREVTPQFQATGIISQVFPLDTKRVYAILVLQGAKVGDVVTGRWYQLSVENAPPDGSFVTEASVNLTNDNLTPDGLARVALDLGTSNDNPLPPGDWLVRISVNDKFIRTMGFGISQFVVYPNAGAQTQPTVTPGGSPTTTAGQPTPPPGQPTQPVTQPTQPAGQPTQPAPTATQSPAQPTTYTVVSGDTLTIIAEKFKPANETADQYAARLREANDLPEGSILQVGQVLNLPGPP